MSKELLIMTREKHPLYHITNGRRVKICADSQSVGGLLILYDEKGQEIARSNNQGKEYIGPRGMPIVWDDVAEKWVPAGSLAEEV